MIDDPTISNEDADFASVQAEYLMQCWGVQQGREYRIKEQGRIFLNAKPNALYVWAYQGQIGTSESCDDPAACWEAASDILKQAKTI